MSRIVTIVRSPRRLPILLAVVIAGTLLVLASLIDMTPPAERSGGGDSGAADPERSVVHETAVDPALAPEHEGGAGVAADDVATMGGPAATGEALIGPAADATSPIPAPRALDVPELDARIIRTGVISLRLRRGSFEDAWSDAQGVAGAFGGYVVAASRTGADDGPRSGTITMRVPSRRFDAAVDRLRDLDRAKVERLDVSSQDVTQEFVDVRSRLRHDRAVEARLLALLAQTRRVSEVLAVQARLDQVQEQIELSRGRLQYLERLTSMSTIEVSLRERGERSDDRDEPILGEAWGDARERFTENVAAALVWLGGALPALIGLAIAFALARAAWRRSSSRRDAAERPESGS